MSTDEAVWLVPVAMIIAAFIAGLFSFLNLVLSKEKKISELRQEWIDGLRADLSVHIAAILSVRQLSESNRASEGAGLNPVEYAKTILAPHYDASASYSRVLLRLNPEDESQAQRDLVKQLEASRDQMKAKRFDEVDRSVELIRSTARQVLKEEWEVVKQGERLFRWSKWVAAACMGTAPIAVLTWWLVSTG